MISSKQIEKLKMHWGYMADALQCTAEIRLYDPSSIWQCYIYAVNPEDEDEIMCIIDGSFIETCKWRLSDIKQLFNCHGDEVLVDHEYRPRIAQEILRKLTACKADLQ